MTRGAGFPAEWPADTEFVAFGDAPTLVALVTMLYSLGATFIVHPGTGEIAMSRDAARAIGAL